MRRLPRWRKTLGLQWILRAGSSALPQYWMLGPATPRQRSMPESTGSNESQEECLRRQPQDTATQPTTGKGVTTIRKLIIWNSPREPFTIPR